MSGEDKMPNNRLSIYKGLVMITHIGLMMIIPIVAAVYFGNYLDTKFQTGNIFLIVLIILGVMVGFTNVYKMVMHDIKKSKK